MKTWTFQCPHCCKEIEVVPVGIRYIQESDFPARAYNALMRNGIRTFNELETFTDKRLLTRRGIGRKGLSEIRQVVPRRDSRGGTITQEATRA